MANRFNIEIPQGATFTKQVEYLDNAEHPIDLSGCSARLMVREHYTDTAPLVAINSEASNDQGFITLTPESGTLDILITDEATAELKAPMVGVWDLELTFVDGTVQRLLEGKVSVTPEVTR